MRSDEILKSLNIDAAFLEEMYKLYEEKSDELDSSWKRFFETLDQKPIVSSPTSPTLPSSNILQLIEAYRTFGHLMADVNPLEKKPQTVPYELNLNTLGFSPSDLSQTVPVIERLKKIYCGTIGYEFMHVEDPKIKDWILSTIENPSQSQLSKEEKQAILEELNKSELFEAFLHTKYMGQKRFSLEGGESFIPMMQKIITMGASLGASEFVLGMAHRGRLNVLSNVMQKSYRDIFSHFEDSYLPGDFEGAGDVKYHIGFSTDNTLKSGQKVQITLLPNPSHLESIYPVMEGYCRARQKLKNDPERDKVIPIVIHGDAALSGQGVIYETMQLSKIDGYATGGTIHIAINNQIGFTTLPKEGRSTRYCTDIANTFGSPIFHVNGDDPEACVLAAKLAIELRERFHTDVFIDLISYRKYGHNESDEPHFTQPLEYQIIKNQKPVRERYRDALIDQGVVEKKVIDDLEKQFKKELQEEMKLTQASLQSSPPAPVETKKREKKEDVNTSVPKETLQSLAEKFCKVPSDFHLHPKLQQLMNLRLEMAKGEKPIDWGMGELFTYSTLLTQGISIRLSGQDSIRGTFSHRHAIFVDQKEKRRYSPLENLSQNQGLFEIYNSPLSEFAVMAYEYGYSLVDPKNLVIWEAQFGDFANNAQTVVDQFLASGEQKWGKKSNLVLYLPHGYEGQGPEHSSARIERYLSLGSKENMVIVNPTSPKQLFHLLRGHMLLPEMKPLIIFTPKGYLRHPQCISSLDEFAHGQFEEIIDDTQDPKNVKKLIFISSFFYYEVVKERPENTAIVRIEKLYPLNTSILHDIIKKYDKVDEVLWVQPEPYNMGVWGYIFPILKWCLPEHMPLKYVGRESSATTATGSHAFHVMEQKKIIDALKRL